MKMLLPALYVQLFRALRGYLLWHNIVHHHISGNCAVILVPPSEDNTYARYAVKHLDAFFRYNYFKNVIFLSAGYQLDEMFREYGMDKRVQEMINLSPKKIDNLLAFCNANLDDGRLIIASLDVPYGRNMMDYLKTGVLSKEEIFLVGVYNVSDEAEVTRLEGK